MKKIYLVGAGPINSMWLQNNIPIGAPIIGVDGGYDQLKGIGKTPDIYIGDGDSGEIPSGKNMILLPTQKERTDMEAAVLYALEAGFREINIFGGTGGRLDHFFGNIALLEKIYNHQDGKQKGFMYDEQNRIQFFKGAADHVLMLKKSHGKYISIIPLDEIVSGVTLENFIYPLYNETIKRHETRAISNEWKEDWGKIYIQKGRGLIIESGEPF